MGWCATPEGTIKYLVPPTPKLHITEDIQPLTAFRNNSVAFMQQLKSTQRPIVLTVNGNPKQSSRTPPPISAYSI